MLTISNLSRLKDILLPAAIVKFEKLFAVATEGDRQTLNEVVDQLDSIVFDDFIKRKTAALEEIVSTGVLRSGVDWYTAPKPTGTLLEAEQCQLTFGRGPTLHVQSFVIPRGYTCRDQHGHDRFAQADAGSPTRRPDTGNVGQLQASSAIRYGRHAGCEWDL